MVKCNKNNQMPKIFSQTPSKERIKRADIVTETISATHRGILSGIDEYKGVWGKKQATHLLRRTMFGATKTDINIMAAKSMSQAVDFLFLPQAKPAQPINDYNNIGDDKKLVDKIVPAGQPYADLPNRDIDAEFWKNVSLKCWWFNNIIEQKISIHEKMMFFWSNHVPVQIFEVYEARFGYRYLEVLRRNSTGNFKTLMREITTDPAMLRFLNGDKNSKFAPDENYGRELQELFCIGKGPNSKYTETDVKTAARVLTGWKVDWTKSVSTFNANDHDSGDKAFSSFYNNKVIKGQTGANGAKEVDDLLDMIFGNAECALHLVRKLYRFLVYHSIDAATETNVIAPLAQLLRTSNFDIKPVLLKLLKSEHFYDVLNQGVILKTPLDFAIGLLREFNIPNPPKNNPREVLWVRMGMYWWLRDMLLDIGDPPNVAGWPAWYQSPQFDKYWITTNTLPKRGNLTDMMIYWGYENEDKSIKYGINEFEFTKSLSNPSDPNALISEVIELFFSIDVDATVRKNLKNILLSDQASDYYWTNAWNDYLADPKNVMKQDVVKWRLKSFYQHIMQMEEYQMM